MNHLFTYIFILIITLLSFGASAQKKELYPQDLYVEGESHPKLLYLDIDTSELNQKGEYYSLFIAIEDYKSNTSGFDELNSPLKSAKKLWNTLKSDYTFVDDERHHIFLENPSREEIYDAFEKMRNRVRATDQILIFYAGHGDFDSDLQEGYWIPKDGMDGKQATWFSNSDLCKLIHAIPSKHTLIIADACFGGTVVDQSLEINGDENSPSRRALTSGPISKVLDDGKFVEILIKVLEKNPVRSLKTDDLYEGFVQSIKKANLKKNPRYDRFISCGRLKQPPRAGHFVFNLKIKRNNQR